MSDLNTKSRLNIQQIGNILNLKYVNVVPPTGQQFVYTLTKVGELTGEIFLLDSPCYFLIDENIDYLIGTFRIYKWTNSSISHTDDLVTYNNELWKALTTTTVGIEPSTSNSEWTKGIYVDLELDSNYYTHNIDLVEYVPCSLSADEDYKITKTGDHTFTISYFGINNITKYEIFDYNELLITTGNTTNNSISISLSEDGIYYAKIYLDNSSIIYPEIYDLTNTEKCYLKLIEASLCNCLDCNDCNSKQMQKALSIMNAYNFLRDYIYSNRAINMGIISEETLRTNYLKFIGILFDKLRLITKNCLCNN